MLSRVADPDLKPRAGKSGDESRSRLVDQRKTAVPRSGLIQPQGGASGRRGLVPTRVLLPALVMLVGLLAGAGIAFVSSRSSPAVLTAAGTLESDETLVSAQVTGNIVALPAAGGERCVQRRSRSSDSFATAATTGRRGRRANRSKSASTAELRPPRPNKRDRDSGPRTRGRALRLPGKFSVAVARADQLKLTIYVREADLTHVLVGQALTITADPFPGRTFAGKVTSVNTSAEFTPRNVQTQSDRLNLAFGVQATVANPDGDLKAGMPVDVRFDPDSAS